MALQNAELKLNQRRKQAIEEISSSEKYGKRIYLLGSAEFGPTNEPIRIQSTAGLYNAFGRNGSLIHAFHGIKYLAPDAEIWLVKTTGEHSMAYLNVNMDSGEVFKEALIFSSKDSNEVYNDILIRVERDKLRFVYPGQFNNLELIYYYKDYPTIQSLCDAINKDTKSGIGFIYVYCTCDQWLPTEYALYPCNMSMNYMFGGQCGLYINKNMLYYCLARTYDLLESADIDLIVPVDAFIDDVFPYDGDEEEWQYGMKYYHSDKDYLGYDPLTKKPRTFLNQLINYCLKQNRFGLVTLGIMGFNSLNEYYSDYMGESDEAVAMMAAAMDYNIRHCDYPEYGFLTSVVGGDLNYGPGIFLANAYLAFAALSSTVKTSTGIINIPLGNRARLYTEFNEPALQALSDYGISTFRQSTYYEQPVIYDAVTSLATLYPESEFRNYINTRMISVVMAHVNDLLQIYIGENLDYLLSKGIVDKDLKILLTSLKNKGYLTNFSFLVMPYRISNQLKVYLTLETAYTVSAVKTCSVIGLEFVEGVN